MTTVLIRGEGVAACACARLLSQAGLHVTADAVERPKLPAIMVAAATQNLVQDVFERPNIFADAPRIRRRVVAWGRSEAIELPHSAVVISEETLLDRIRPHAADQNLPASPGTMGTGNPDWAILTSRPLPVPSLEHQFGSRIATASSVSLKPQAGTDACWIESLESGWLFLLPGRACAWLLSVGGTVDSLLGQSRLVAMQIDRIQSESRGFPSHPRVADPLCQTEHGGTAWLACGTAALGFDPLCGDGSGHAIREAILASALIRAAHDGADPRGLAAHYRARLLAGFMRHLQTCQGFYETGLTGNWWREQLESTRRGLDWCHSHLEQASEFRYRLKGFTLESV